jgi:hypothetical protein
LDLDGVEGFDGVDLDAGQAWGRVGHWGILAEWRVG